MLGSGVSCGYWDTALGASPITTSEVELIPAGNTLRLFSFVYVPVVNLPIFALSEFPGGIDDSVEEFTISGMVDQGVDTFSYLPSTPNTLKVGGGVTGEQIRYTGYAHSGETAFGTQHAEISGATRGYGGTDAVAHADGVEILGTLTTPPAIALSLKNGPGGEVRWGAGFQFDPVPNGAEVTAIIRAGSVGGVVPIPRDGVLFDDGIYATATGDGVLSVSFTYQGTLGHWIRGFDY